MNSTKRDLPVFHFPTVIESTKDAIRGIERKIENLKKEKEILERRLREYENPKEFVK